MLTKTFDHDDCYWPKCFFGLRLNLEGQPVCVLCFKKKKHELERYVVDNNNNIFAENALGTSRVQI